MTESGKLDPTGHSQQVIESVHYWADGLLSFRTSRDPAFRFSPGHYARLGLGEEDGLVWRPFSMVSAPDDTSLEFLAKLVPGGQFSEWLATVQPGNTIAIDKRCFGFLTANTLKPATALWMLSSGTGLGPFISIVRAAVSLEGYEQLVVVHSVRNEGELAYREELQELASQEDRTIHYIPVITRAKVAGILDERIPALIENGRLQLASPAPFDATASCVMVCGNPDLCSDLRTLLTARDFRTTRRGVAGNLAFEKYW